MCGAFECPTFPGATAAAPLRRLQLQMRSARSRELASHQAAKGIALKPPRRVQAVIADKTSGFDAAAGESIVMVPLILDRGRPVKANISLDAGLLEAIDDEAVRRGLTRSGFLASAALATIGEDAITGRLRPRHRGARPAPKGAQKKRG